MDFYKKIKLTLFFTFGLFLFWFNTAYGVSFLSVDGETVVTLPDPPNATSYGYVVAQNSNVWYITYLPSSSAYYYTMGTNDSSTLASRIKSSVQPWSCYEWTIGSSSSWTLNATWTINDVSQSGSGQRFSNVIFNSVDIWRGGPRKRWSSQC